jgi:hypothetical protein
MPAKWKVKRLTGYNVKGIDRFQLPNFLNQQLVSFRNPQLQYPTVFIKYVDETHVDPACDRMPRPEWLRRSSRATQYARSSGTV